VPADVVYCARRPARFALVAPNRHKTKEDRWRDLFTDDFVGDTTEAGGSVIVGVDEFMAYPRNTIGKPSQATVHQVHAPEIELTSATTARGVWALNDVVRLVPAVTLHGYGHYHET
jgi:SnoaL-like domain